MAICLLILRHGTCNRMVQEIFQHSSETISRHFEKMITLLGAPFAAAYVKPSDPTFSEVPTKIQDYPIYWPHFKVCILLYIWISVIVYKIIQCMWNWKLLMFLLGLHRCDWWHTCYSGYTYWEVYSILWKKGISNPKCDGCMWLWYVIHICFAWMGRCSTWHSHFSWYYL